MSGSGLMTTQRARRPHLAKVTGEVGDLRRDIEEELAPLVAATWDEYVDPVAPATAGLEALTLCTVAPRTVTVFEAAGIAALAAGGRNVTLTNDGSGTPTDVPATALVTGTYLGEVQTETIVPPTTATTVAGVKPFDTVESVAFGAAVGAAGTLSIGFGQGMGMTKLPVARGGLVTAITEIEDGAVVAHTGAWTVERLYTPSTIQDGAKDYAILYEYDAAA